jgi:mono/diheme cytochrome c family protein
MLKLSAVITRLLFGNRLGANGLRAVGFILISSFTSVVAYADQDPDQDQELAGEELYGEFCEDCHGYDKSGLKGFKGNLEALQERLGGDTEEMPDFTDFFEDDEIENLYEYLSREPVSES